MLAPTSSLLQDNMGRCASSDGQAMRATAAGKVVQARSSVHAVSWITHSSPPLQSKKRYRCRHRAADATKLHYASASRWLLSIAKDARFLPIQISGFSALDPLCNRHANKTAKNAVAVAASASASALILTPLSLTFFLPRAT